MKTDPTSSVSGTAGLPLAYEAVQSGRDLATNSNLNAKPKDGVADKVFFNVVTHAEVPFEDNALGNLVVAGRDLMKYFGMREIQRPVSVMFQGKAQIHVFVK